MRWHDLPPRATPLGGRPDPAAGLGGGYRYRNTPGWDPAALGPMKVDLAAESQAQARRARAVRSVLAEARRAEFARYRDEGLSVAEAGAAVGVTVETARVYERLRRRRAAGEA